MSITNTHKLEKFPIDKIYGGVGRAWYFCDGLSKSWKHFRKKIYIGFQIHHVLDKPVVDICIVFVMSIAYRNSIIALLLCDMGPSLDLVMSSENPLPKRGHHFDTCKSSFCPCYTSYQGSLWALSLALAHFQTHWVNSWALEWHCLYQICFLVCYQKYLKTTSLCHSAICTALLTKL